MLSGTGYPRCAAAPPVSNEPRILATGPTAAFFNWKLRGQYAEKDSRKYGEAVASVARRTILQGLTAAFSGMAVC